MAEIYETMKIWKKILFGFISVIFIMIIVDFYALKSDIDIITEINNLEVSKRVELVQSNKIAYFLQLINSNQKEIFLESGKPGKEAEISASRLLIDKNIPLLDTAVNVLSHATKIGYEQSEEKADIEREEKELQLIDSLTEEVNLFISSAWSILRYQDIQENGQAEDLYENVTEPAAKKIQQIIAVVVHNAEKEVEWAIRQLNEQVSRAIHLGIYLTILSIIFALSIGFYISNSISGPLEKLITGTKQISAGNLNTKVELNTKGELQLLVDSFNSMAKELKNKVSSIDKINRELLKSNNSKDVYFSIIAHDLKNPFNAVLGLADLLTTQYDNFDENERKEIIDEINRSSKILYELLDNLLTWARSQRGMIKIKKDKLFLKQITQASITAYWFNARQKQIEIRDEIAEDTLVCADRYTLSVIIDNILSNAIKFTPEGGKITFSAKAESQKIEIRIKDTGVGMSKNVIDQLLSNTEVIKTTLGTKTEKGAGLGMVLIKDFIQKNGGILNIQSEPNKGTDFIIYLPLI